MKTPLQPRAVRPFPVTAIALLMAALAIAAVLIPMVRSGVTVPRLANGAGVLLIAGSVVALLLLEERRARSVVLSESGVSSLVWSLRPSFPFVWLSQLDIPWSAVEGVGTRGLVIGLKSGRRKLLVNTYLFPEPNEVGPYIIEQLSRVGRDGHAL